MSRKPVPAARPTPKSFGQLFGAVLHWIGSNFWRSITSAIFAGIVGYELTAITNRGGHHNVFFRDTGSERVGVQIAHRENLFRTQVQLNQPSPALEDKTIQQVVVQHLQL